MRAGKARNPQARRYDREILYLALPALGALAAEPTYVLVDTAIVGHLGTPQLAALAIAATLLATGLTLFNFLTYGTTAQVARLHGAGEETAAGRLGAQALWLAVALGGALFADGPAPRDAGGRLMGGSGEMGEMAVTYLRISALGLPFAMIALAGQGFLRGIGEPAPAARDPGRGERRERGARGALRLRVRVGHRGLRLGYGAGPDGHGRRLRLRALARPRRSWRSLGVAPSSLGGDASAAQGRRGHRREDWGVALLLRARERRRRAMGEAPLAAHQVAFRLFIFLALVLDAIAIAGQIMVGRSLGAGDARGAYAAAARMIFWSVAVGVLFAAGLLAGTGIIPRAFTGDPAVIEQARALWPLFVLMQPIGAAVFALDGILIGASDTHFLKWSMVAALAVFAPLALAALSLGLGVVGLWAALNVLMAVRLVTCGARFLGRRWAVVGA